MLQGVAREQVGNADSAGPRSRRTRRFRGHVFVLRGSVEGDRGVLDLLVFLDFGSLIVQLRGLRWRARLVLIFLADMRFW